jgi:single-strand DNA-binding protein
MNTLKNSIQIIGNLGADPEVKVASSNNKYARFNIATTEKYTNKAGEKTSETTWHRITLWNQQAELAEKYLSKGSMVAIQGKMVNNDYTDKDGNKRSSYEIKVSEIMLLGGSKSSTTNMEASQVLVSANGEDNLPF